MLGDFHVLRGGVGIREVPADGGWTLAGHDRAEFLGRLAGELAEGLRAYSQGSGCMCDIVLHFMERSHSADTAGRPAFQITSIAIGILLLLKLLWRSPLLVRVANPMALFAPFTLFREARHADMTTRFVYLFSLRLEGLRRFLFDDGFVVASRGFV